MGREVAQRRVVFGFGFGLFRLGGGFGFSFGLPDGSIKAMTSPTAAFSPVRLTILPSVPETGDGNSTVAFSDSSVTTFSSLLTASPSRLSHGPISTSVTDSPTEGIFNSTAM